MEHPVAYVHDRTGFASLLYLERMRSDRSRVPFSLAVFRFDSHDAAERCAQFADELCTTARVTDHIGWMKPGSVGIILWNTHAKGAWHFVDKAVEHSELRPDCDVFVYPADSSTTKPASDDTNSTQHETADTDDDSPTSEQAPVVSGVGSESSSSGGQTSTLVAEKIQTESAVRIEKNLELTEQLVQELLQNESLEPHEARCTQPLESLFELRLPWWKRAIDIAGASAGLLVLSPLFLAVAAAIKFTSPGPVFFSQMRSGRGGRPFPMFKFRSMVVDAEERKKELMQQNEQDGPAFKIENDPRITSIGHIIRKSSIDELPQLWNVLRGEMSIVGPRPLPCSETDGCDNWQRRRLEATPGLTCIWQVQDRRTKIAFADWARMDIRYIKSRTLKHDVQLVLKTFRSIFGRKGS